MRFVSTKLATATKEVCEGVEGQDVPYYQSVFLQDARATHIYVCYARLPR